ncbi:hypothetical protein J2X52_003342 [Luteimonas sp. 3794]|nr:hypothetical protein [Luteimonas sp. 3794]
MTLPAFNWESSSAQMRVDRNLRGVDRALPAMRAGKSNGRPRTMPSREGSRDALHPELEP